MSEEVEPLAFAAGLVDVLRHAECLVERIHTTKQLRAWASEENADLKRRALETIKLAVLLAERAK